jgi:O-methyltransferase
MNGLAQKVLLLDTFQGMPATTRFDVGRRIGEFAPPGDQVSVLREQAHALGVADRVEIHQGLFAETFKRLEGRHLTFAFVHIDANIYEGTLQACEFNVSRVPPGGRIVFDDYNGVCDLGARLAIDVALKPAGLRPRMLAGSSAYVEIR